MATEMAVNFAHQSMSAASFGHGFQLHSLHHHGHMDGYDYYTQPRAYQDHLMAGHGPHEDDDDIDEDDIVDDDSDNESMYTSADMESEVASDDLMEPEPNVAEQLLEFAEAVNRDIQKYFGRKNSTNDPESVGTVYQDRFASGKSGRELYYADILRVAENGDTAESYSTGRSRKAEASVIPSISSPLSVDNANVINANYSGKKGLGPLKELFDFAIGGCMDARHNGHRCDGHWSDQESSRKCFQTLPWRKRALPNSFFVEPHPRGSSSRGGTNTASFGSHSTIMPEQETPDFSDLVANFTSDYDHQLATTTASH